MLYLMELIKRVVGWLGALALWLWWLTPRALDWVGRSTLPDDWRQLMTERLPAALDWLFSTPGWVPGILATVLTLWLMWISWPRQGSAMPSQDGSSPGLQIAPRSAPLASVADIKPDLDRLKPVPVKNIDGVDFDLVAPDTPLRIIAMKTSDYTDITVDLLYKNRSQRALWIKCAGVHLSVDGKLPEKPGGSVTRPFASGKTAISRMGTVRLYGESSGRTGVVQFYILFGLSEETARTIVGFIYFFLIKEEPIQNNTEQFINFDIIENNTIYDTIKKEEL